MRCVGSCGSVIQRIIQTSVVQFGKDNMALRFYQQLHNLSIADFQLQSGCTGLSVVGKEYPQQTIYR